MALTRVCRLGEVNLSEWVKNIAERISEVAARMGEEQFFTCSRSSFHLFAQFSSPVRAGPSSLGARARLGSLKTLDFKGFPAQTSLKPPVQQLN